MVTGHHQIRLYDTRAQRRPIHSVEIGDRPFTRCCASPDDNLLIVGDTTGRVTRVDLRVLRMTGVYKGAAGAIHDIAIHPSGRYVATVGLDRIMRVYDTETREQMHRVYLRQRLNCVLFSEEEQVQTFAEEQESDSLEVEKDDVDRSEEGENPAMEADEDPTVGADKDSSHEDDEALLEDSDPHDSAEQSEQSDAEE